MYLLDTNIVSELRKAKMNKANMNVVNWAQRIEASEMFISVITVLEIEMGVLQKERADPTQGAILRKWLESQVLPAFTGRIIAMDTAIALQCAKLHVPNPRSERDAMIAATAMAHKLTVATRNVSDFVKTGVKLVNPWDGDILTGTD